MLALQHQDQKGEHTGIHVSANAVFQANSYQKKIVLLTVF